MYTFLYKHEKVVKVHIDLYIYIYIVRKGLFFIVFKIVFGNKRFYIFLSDILKRL